MHGNDLNQSGYKMKLRLSERFIGANSKQAHGYFLIPYKPWVSNFI